MARTKNTPRRGKAGAARNRPNPAGASRESGRAEKKMSVTMSPERAAHILEILKHQYPAARTELVHRTPFELLVATILSAQCTDQRVNMVTKELFAKYPTPAHFAASNQAELERDIHSTGFFRMKARSLIACSTALLKHHGGVVPSTMEDLITLPGVGRKTANVVLSEGFGISEGIVVDTHVQRVARRLALTAAQDPQLIERDLMALVPRSSWQDVGLLLILHGRRVCNARAPRCDACSLATLCPSAGLFMRATVKHNRITPDRQRRSTEGS